MNSPESKHRTQEKPMRRILIAAFGLLAFAAMAPVSEPAFAEESCDSHYVACVNNAEKCSDPDKCNRRCDHNTVVCRNTGYWANLPQKMPPGTPCKDCKVTGEQSGTWNGKYTTIMTGPGSSVAFKQGVDTGSPMSILGPDGNMYRPWDPKLGELLAAKGSKDAHGNPLGFLNEKMARNEFAVLRDQQIRKLAADRIARGEKNVTVPPPTGTRNLDAWGNKAPDIRDHRTPGKPVAAGGPPPAAAPGTVSTTAVTNPAAMGNGAIRDHRPGGNAANSSGGVKFSTAPPPKVGSNAGGSSGGNGGKGNSKF
jgi:hypothetical protein